MARQEEDLYAPIRAQQSALVTPPPRARSRVAVNGRAYETVSSEYTNQTPEELRAEGRVFDPATNSWARTVGSIQVPDDIYAAARDRQEEEQRHAAEREAVKLVGDSGLLNVPGMNAFTRGAAEQAPGLDEALAFGTALGTGSSYSEARRRQNMIADYDRENSGVERSLGGIAGFTAGLAAPGGAYIRGARLAPGASEAAVRAAQGAQALRAGVVSGGYGGAYGLGAGEGSFADRLPGGAIGAATGFLGGVGVQKGVQAFANSGFGQRLGSIAGGFAPADPELTAAQRLTRTVTDPAAAYAERDRLRSLGLNPSLMDVTGGTTERLVRAAAGPAGPAAELAVENMAARQANLKPEVMGVTRALSDDPRSATAVREGLEETRDALATTQYREPYAAQVPLTPEAVRAIRGGGQSAIREAIQDELADPNFDAAVVSELEGLLTADLDQIPTVSGRALDRVRIALRDTSGGLMRGDRPNRTRARGFAQRVEGVDTALDSAPGLIEARDTYRNLSGAVEAIDNAAQVFNTDPQDFARLVQALTPEQRQAMTIGLRQNIMDALGTQQSAGSGSLQRLSDAPYTRQNLEALLGAEEAAQYLGSIRARVQQAQRAARVSPNTNSQTFGRANDEASFNAVETVAAALDGMQAVGGNAMATARTANRVSNFVAARTMTPEVREAIVSLGIGSADELERVLELGVRARQGNRPPPREVRAYLAKVQGQLGAQSPITVRLEQLLLPGRVAAEEEQP